MTALVRCTLAGSAVLACFFSSLFAGAPGAPSKSSITRYSPDLDAIIPPDARIEIVASGFGFVEGPVWVRSGQYLLFSDIPRNKVMRWSAKEGVRVFLQPSGYSGPPRPTVEGSNGLALDSHGRLILCEHGDRRVSRLNPDGTRTTLAASFEGKRLNSPNDACSAPMKASTSPTRRLGCP